MDSSDNFIHEALFYDQDEAFLDICAPFVREGLAAGEAVLVATDARKIGLLRGALGASAAEVAFLDMRIAGRNPARIIPIWQSFLDSGGGPVRGIGEPVWGDRSDHELVECHHHEMLLNSAFDQPRPFSLLCPYDERELDADVLARVFASHSAVLAGGQTHCCDGYARSLADHCPFDGRLSDPPPGAVEVEFDVRDLATIRHLLTDHGERAGLCDTQIDDLRLAGHEVATNSVMHGGGCGTLRVWVEDDEVVCEIRDRGCFHDPLVGRVEPPDTMLSGRGLWLANCVMDLVQIRSSAFGSAVRMRLRAV
ncbi:MAG: anti-sigma factor RsbA family regulatory protein [Solirubrobacterales bacterium]